MISPSTQSFEPETIIEEKSSILMKGLSELIAAKWSSHFGETLNTPINSIIRQRVRKAKSDSREMIIDKKVGVSSLLNHICRDGA